MFQCNHWGGCVLPLFFLLAWNLTLMTLKSNIVKLITLFTVSCSCLPLGGPLCVFLVAGAFWCGILMAKCYTMVEVLGINHYKLLSGFAACSDSLSWEINTKKVWCSGSVCIGLPVLQQMFCCWKLGGSWVLQQFMPVVVNKRYLYGCTNAYIFILVYISKRIDSY